MPNEFQLDLCFIRESGDSELFRREIRLEMARVFDSAAKWHAEEKIRDRLDIAVVEASGLTLLQSEEEVLRQLESRMESECWEWLSGYRLAVIPKEDAGSCRLKRKGRVPHELST